jgi:hypothetical protein
MKSLVLIAALTIVSTAAFAADHGAHKPKVAIKAAVSTTTAISASEIKAEIAKTNAAK